MSVCFGLECEAASVHEGVSLSEGPCTKYPLGDAVTKKSPSTASDAIKSTATSAAIIPLFDIGQQKMKVYKKCCSFYCPQNRNVYI